MGVDNGRRSPRTVSVCGRSPVFGGNRLFRPLLVWRVSGLLLSWSRFESRSLKSLRKFCLWNCRFSTDKVFTKNKELKSKKGGFCRNLLLFVKMCRGLPSVYTWKSTCVREVIFLLRILRHTKLTLKRSTMIYDDLLSLSLRWSRKYTTVSRPFPSSEIHGYLVPPVYTKTK